MAKDELFNMYDDIDNDFMLRFFIMTSFFKKV